MGTDYDSWLIGNADHYPDPCDYCGCFAEDGFESIDPCSDPDCGCHGDSEPDVEKLIADRDRDRWERFLERI